MKKYSVLLLVTGYLILIIGFMVDAWADVVIDYEMVKTRSKDIPPGSVIKISLSESALRFDLADLVSMIYRKDGTLIVIDHKRRSFWNMKGIIREMERMHKEMERQLAQIPPEQRKMVEAMMRSRLNIQISEIEPCENPKVIKDESVNGIPSKVVDGCKSIVNGQWQVCRYWFADGEKLGLREGDLKIFVDFMKFQRKIFSFQRQVFKRMSFSYQPSDRKIIGLPYKFPFVIKAASIRGGEEINVMRLKDLKIRKVPEEVFSIPKGYRDETPGGYTRR